MQLTRAFRQADFSGAESFYLRSGVRCRVTGLRPISRPNAKPRTVSTHWSDEIPQTKVIYNLTDENML